MEAGLEGRVAWIRLGCPEGKNLLNPPSVRALAEALENANADPGAGAVLILQKGDIFSAGIEYDSLTGPESRSDFSDNLFRLFATIRGMRKPVLAAVRGACTGAGVGLVAACHYVLAAQGTKFAVTDMHFGSWPYAFYGVLVFALGERRARELSLTGRVFPASDAHCWGLVDELAPPFELEDRAFQMAAGLASLSPEAMAAGLEFTACPSPEEARRRFELALGSADLAEGVAARREKRRPRWPSLENLRQEE